MARSPKSSEAGGRTSARRVPLVEAWGPLVVVILLVAVGLAACGVDRPLSTPTTSTHTEASTTTTTEGLATTTTSSVPSTTSTEGVTTTEAPQPTFAEHARISTWYTPAAADNSEWVHFKAVDEGGYTVAEVPGSDLMNMIDEANAMAQTAKRVELVNKLRQQMVDNGWTEIGVRGDWYEYQFGR